MAIYRAFRAFVLAALRNATVTREELGRFAEATDEALFILGPEVSDYLREVYRKGVKLQYTNGRIAHERLAPRDDYSEVIQENYDLLNWFTEHIESGRLVFAKYLLLE